MVGDVAVGKVKAKKGKATVTTTVNAAGTLELSGGAVKPATATAGGRGEVALQIKPTSKAKRALRKKGSARVRFTVTFTPLLGTPDSADGTAKLKKKSKKKD